MIIDIMDAIKANNNIKLMNNFSMLFIHIIIMKVK